MSEELFMVCQEFECMSRIEIDTTLGRRTK